MQSVPYLAFKETTMKTLKTISTGSKVIAVCFWLILMVFVLASPVLAQDVELKNVIPILPVNPGFVDFRDPANPHAASFDIGWVSRDKYYFTDRGATATAYGACGGRVDVIDASGVPNVEDPICGFVGNHGSGVSGPNGVLVIPATNELWAGDGDSTVKVVDLNTKSIVATISTGGKKRADELAYDPTDDVIIIGNDSENLPTDTPPGTGQFLTLIDRGTRKVLGQIFYDGSDAQHPLATAGMEQPVFDENTGLFYQAVPATTDNPGGEIDAIDPVTIKIVARFPTTDCLPHGLVLGPLNQLLLGCSDVVAPVTGTPGLQIMDDRNGTILAVIPQVAGADESWYNSGDRLYYVAASNCTVAICGGPVFAVINADSGQWLQNVPTATGAHSIAVNPRNNLVFSPRGPVPPDPASTDVGVAVYGHADD
jgi:hypothetical protein